MKLFKNKIFIGVVSIGLALVIAFVVLPNSNKVETIDVVQMKQDVLQNTYITEDLIDEIKISKEVVPNGEY